MENGAHSQRQGLCKVTSRDGGGNVPSPSGVVTNGRRQKDLQDQKAGNNSNSMLMCHASISQPCSGPEDNSTEAHKTLTVTSTTIFVDAHTIDESSETHSLLGVMEVHIKEFVLIDDDDDSGMSLREKTVTDMSIMDVNAADLVCGKLPSITTDTSSECKEESLAPEPPPPALTLKSSPAASFPFNDHSICSFL
ncbi:paralemmin-2 [Oncorhynchus kisutch]|uniref:paralemmin-2 n=1 Tax=Oncorhynchus kisutch TaxID=8019 RepID=UPI0012DC2A36|nr:paralemmin-2-like [Oncorhynchus kisutch]